MTLTYDLDLDILPLDLHVKILVHTSVRSAGIVRLTDDAKIITPNMSHMWGVITH